MFKNYVIARDKYRPDFFLYENNKSMSPAIREQITRELGVEPALINSARVSGQSRQRLYWAGRRNVDGTYSQVEVEQPEDLGIMLRDVLDAGICWREKAYTIDSNYYKTLGQQGFDKQSGRRKMVAEFVGDIDPVRIRTIQNDAKRQDFDSQQYRIYSPDGKSVTICGQGGGVGAKTGLYAVPVEFEASDGKIYPVYEVRDGFIKIQDKQYPIKLADGYYIIRKLTVSECMRLQTVPEWYEFPVSPTQAYKMIGNGWTCDVIKHIMSHFDGIETESVEVLSMYDGMSCGHIALDKLGVNVSKYYATEIDKYAIKTTQHNYPDTIQLGDAFQVREDDWCLSN